MLEHGADGNVKNNKGQVPADLCKNSKEIRQMLGQEDQSSAIQDNNSQNSSFVPNYLRHPQVNYEVDLRGVETAEDRSNVSVVSSKQLNEDRNREQKQLQSFKILKIRVAGDSNDADFIEIDLPSSKWNYESLVQVMCQELNFDTNVKTVDRIRKLPNTRLRRDVEVQRLEDYSELELVIA